MLKLKWVMRGLLLTLLLTALAGCSASRGNLEGAWELDEPGTLDPKGPAVKILVDGHFAFGRQSPDGGVGWAGGGTYSYDGETYTETITYHYMSTFVGTRIKFACDLEGDTWHHEAEFELDGRKYHVDEVWRRLEE